MSVVRNSRNPSDCLALTHSDNRAYLAPHLRHFVQILLRRTSASLGTSGEMTYR